MTRKPRYIDDISELAQPAVDPFREEELAELDALTFEEFTPQPRKSFAVGKLALSAFATLLVFAFALWLERLIRALFTEYSFLGWIAVGVAAIGILALFIFVLREFLAIQRLNEVEHLRQSARRAVEFDDRKEARNAVEGLIAFTSHQPGARAGRDVMRGLADDIIDGRPLIHLAESEILRPLDQEARLLIMGAAKRVSIVTAVSPRALVDLGYVFYESIRLIRNLADLYGCRPGKFGFFRMMRRVMAHLAVTSTLAMGDGLVQQVVGHGLAARLSARLGEGVVNGLMTIRIGIAAMDALRPFPFDGEKRPGVSDFTSDLFGGNKNK